MISSGIRRRDGHGNGSIHNAHNTGQRNKNRNRQDDILYNLRGGPVVFLLVRWNSMPLLNGVRPGFNFWDVRKV
jgi:hypothetical protein